MYNCKQCGNNNWKLNTKLVKVTGLVYANCLECGNEISFERRQRLFNFKPKRGFKPLRPKNICRPADITDGYYKRP